MAVAWTTWKKLYTKKGDKWVAKKSKEGFTFDDAKKYLGEVAEDTIDKWVKIANTIIELCEEGIIQLTDNESPKEYAIKIANSRFDGVVVMEGEKVPLRETFAFDSTEAEFNDERRVVTLRIIQGGWSKNNNFYSNKIIKELIPFLLESKKMHLNHQTESDRMEGIGRNLRDWTATIEEAWESDAGAYAKVSMTNNSNNSWLYDEMKNHPDLVGVSIDAMVQARKGKVGDKEGIIIERWHFLNSADFVDRPSAFGGVISVGESVNNKIIDALYTVVENYNNIEGDELMDKIKEDETIKEGKLKKRMDAAKERRRFYDIWWGAQEIIYDIIKDNDNGDDIKKEVSGILDELKSMILEVDLTAFKESIERFDQLIKGLEEIKEKLTKEKEGKKEMTIEDIKTIKYDQLKQAGNTEVFEAIKKEIETDYEDRISKTKEETDKAVKELEDSIEEMKKKNEETEKELKEFKDKERIVKNKETAEKFLKDNEIKKEDIVPEHFKEIIEKSEEEMIKSLEAIKKFAEEKSKGKGRSSNLSDKEKGANKGNGEYSKEKLAEVI